jgi:uncharacterized membrane protein (UPF0127 family)
MQTVTIDLADGRLLCRARLADSFGTRGIGLLTTKSLAPDEGLLIKPCTSVHTWFMRFTIDVVYLTTDGTVVKTTTLKPWRFSFGGKGAKNVLELAKGRSAALGLKAGDILQITDSVNMSGAAAI